MKSMTMISFLWLFLFTCRPELVFSVRAFVKSEFLKTGDTASFECDLRSFDKRSIRSWTRLSADGSKTVLTKDGTVLSDPERISSTFNKFSLTFNVVINNLKRNDSGIYECVEIGKVTTTLTKIYLLVLPPSDQVPTTVSVLRGDLAILRGYSDMEPWCKIFWSRVGKTLPSGSYVQDEMLKIPSATLNDSGTYLCNYEHTEGAGPTFRIPLLKIKLEVVPELDVIVPNSYLIRPTGYAINLTCLVLTPSPVNVTWMKSGERIIPSKKYQQHLRQDASVTMSSVKVAQLCIKNIEDQDHGLYECHVQNEFNTLKGVLQLVDNPSHEHP